MKRYFPMPEFVAWAEGGGRKSNHRAVARASGDLLNACLESLIRCHKVVCMVLPSNIPSPFVRKPSLVFVKGVPGRKGFLSNSGHMFF